MIRAFRAGWIGTGYSADWAATCRAAASGAVIVALREADALPGSLKGLRCVRLPERDLEALQGGVGWLDAPGRDGGRHGA